MLTTGSTSEGGDAIRLISKRTGVICRPSRTPQARQMDDRIRIATVAEVALQQGVSRSTGTLNIMQHRLLFGSNQQELWVPYTLIDTLVWKGSSDNGCAIHLRCRNFVVATFIFKREREAADAFISIARLLPERMEDLQAFVSNYDCSAENGWELYDPVAEFARMGVSTETRTWRLSNANRDYQLCDTYPQVIAVPASVTDEMLESCAKFRSRGRIPILSYLHRENMACITRCSQPLVGFSGRNHDDEALVRAIFSANEQHRADHMGQLRTFSANNLILDARPRANAYANAAMGKGFESTENYVNCRREFLGIENIHVMRDSLEKLIEGTQQVDQGLGNWLTTVESSGWLRHIRTILDGVSKMVRAVAVEGANILVHCSDGWDRTAQLTGLAMLCLDPYYRTVRGFMALIEKEWLSVGYKFSHRSGHLVRGKTSGLATAANASQNGGVAGGAATAAASATPGLAGVSTSGGDPNGSPAATLPAGLTIASSQHHHFSETSPVFLQFLDATWQILQQFPDQFEFTGTFLRAVHRLSLSCDTGTFLYNCERERKANVSSNSLSAWSVLFATMGGLPYLSRGGKGNKTAPVEPHPLLAGIGSPTAYYNPRYSGLNHADPVLYPSASGASVRLWRSMYCPNEGMPLLATFVRPQPPPSAPEGSHLTSADLLQKLCPRHPFEHLNVPGPSFADELDDPSRLPLTQALDDVRRRVAWCKRFLAERGQTLPEHLQPDFPSPTVIPTLKALPHPRSAGFAQILVGPGSVLGPKSRPSSVAQGPSNVGANPGASTSTLTTEQSRLSLSATVEPSDPVPLHDTRRVVSDGTLLEANLHRALRDRFPGTIDERHVSNESALDGNTTGSDVDLSRGPPSPKAPLGLEQSDEDLLVADGDASQSRLTMISHESSLEPATEPASESAAGCDIAVE